MAMIIYSAVNNPIKYTLQPSQTMTQSESHNQTHNSAKSRLPSRHLTATFKTLTRPYGEASMNVGFTCP